MAGCKTDFLCTLRDVFSYIIWRGHFWHPIWIFSKFWISQALWGFSSKSPISPKSPVSKGPLLASNSNRQRMAIFAIFAIFAIVSMSGHEWRRTWNILTNTRSLDPICDAWGKLQPLKTCGVPLLFLERIRFKMRSFGVAVKLLCFHYWHYSIRRYWATTHSCP